MFEKNRALAQASMSGVTQGDRAAATVAGIANQIHDAALKEAEPTLLKFIDRTELPSAEIADWARPHLENLSNALLAQILTPGDHRRLADQYRAIFDQRREQMLRRVKIGLTNDGSVGATEESVRWIRADDAVTLLENKTQMSGLSACRTICVRAHEGLIRARASRLVQGNRSADNIDVPRAFWWARGGAALTQTWVAGDFETWIDDVHCKAYGVSFALSDIQQLIPPEAVVAASNQARGKVGRPAADWWEDALIAICFSHFRGDFKPNRQADVERAIQEWATKHGHEAATSTVRTRAQKLWKAIKAEAEN